MSVSRRTVVITSMACLAAGIGIGGLFALPAPKAITRETKAAQTSGADLRNLADRLATVEQTVERVRSRPTPAPIVAEPAAEEPEVEAAEASATTTPMTREEWAKDVVQHYEAYFGREGDDPEWSFRTEIEIAQTLHEANVEGSSLEVADCHATVCRLELSHTDQNAQAHFMQNIPVKPPFDTSGFYHRVDAPDRTPRTVLYLARAGHELPAPSL
ncbi:hypothetical protein WMF18_36760 [Sorangium sp. So ce315]|uniref:hypothetical protein n=1 Tax=Sorangium sp. So ce315 TaxID=3133299 RepID=UPI003F6377CE